MLKYLVLTIVATGLILFSVATANAEFFPGCPGPEELWEGDCVMLPPEPPPLDDFVFIPMLMTGDGNVEGCSVEFYCP